MVSLVTNLVPKQQITIKTLSPADINEYKAVRMRGLSEHSTSFGETPNEFANRTDEDISRTLSWSLAPIFGAFNQENQLVGILGFRRDGGEKWQHRGMIWGMYVVPESRGSGVASKLIDQAIDFAKNLDGIDHVYLWVEATSPAVKLYQSKGFVYGGIAPRALKVGGNFYDEAFYCLKLSY